MQNQLVWKSSITQGCLNSEGYLYLSIVRRKDISAVPFRQTVI